MSLGKMNATISIVTETVTKDTAGFASVADTTLATLRAYREGRHGTQKWANRAAFSEATDLFRFRVVPDVSITTAQVIVCGQERFEITSVEDIKGRKMYVEVLAKKVVAASG